MSDFSFIKRTELTQYVSLSRSKIKSIIRSGQWIEGVHFTRYSSRMNLFNLQLIQDWLVNKSDPTAHQRAIDNYLANLPSNQNKTNRKQTSDGSAGLRNIQVTKKETVGIL